MPTPEPGVPWTSGGVDDMTSEIEARNDAAEDAAESDSEVAALEAQVTSLPSFVTGPSPHDRAEVVEDGDEVYVKLAGIPHLLGATSGTTVHTDAGTDVVLATITPSANLCAAGDIVRFSAGGTLTNDTGTDKTFNYKLKAGADALFDCGVRTVADMASPSSFRSWSLSGWFRCTANDGGSYRLGTADFRIGGPNGGTTMLFDFMVPSGLHTEDFAVPSALAVTVTMSAADANLNTICNAFTAERLRVGS